MTPNGHAVSIFRKVQTCARHADLAGLDEYMASREFAEHLIGAGPKLQQSVLATCAKVRARCEHLYRISNPPAVLRREKDGHVKWKAPGMLEKLRAAYAKVRDDQAAARMLGISQDAARHARRTYLDASATSS